MPGAGQTISLVLIMSSNENSAEKETVMTAKSEGFQRAKSCQLGGPTRDPKVSGNEES